MKRVLAPASWAPRPPVPDPAFSRTLASLRPGVHSGLHPKAQAAVTAVATLAKGTRGRAGRPGLPTRSCLAPSLPRPSHGVETLTEPLCLQGLGGSERLTLCSGHAAHGCPAGVGANAWPRHTPPPLGRVQDEVISGPVPPGLLIRTTWDGPPTPPSLSPKALHLSPGRADARNLGTSHICTCCCQPGGGPGSPGSGLPSSQAGCRLTGAARTF